MPLKRSPRDYAIHCRIGYEIRQVKDIDCVAQRFFCDFTIFLKWEDPAFKYRMDPTYAQTPIPLEEVNIPEYYIANGVAVKTRDQAIYLDAKDPPGTLTCETMYCGVLSEFMELEYFPVDMQDLSISIRFKSTLVTCETMFPADKYQRVRDTVEMSEWEMYEPQLVIDVGKQGRTTWSLQMKINRQCGYYVYNMLLPVGAFTTVGFYVFLYEADMWYERSTFVLQLILAFVGFKFVISSSLPRVSFFTLLDLYLFFSFLFLVALMAEFLIMKVLFQQGKVDNASGRKLDLMVAGALLTLWLSQQAVFCVRLNAIGDSHKKCLGKLLDLPVQTGEKVSVLKNFLGFSKQAATPSNGIEYTKMTQTPQQGNYQQLPQ